MSSLLLFFLFVLLDVAMLFHTLFQTGNRCGTTPAAQRARIPLVSTNTELRRDASFAAANT